jgi:hypothetical protein
VTRACDECRRKKIKCDGKQPCTHCTVYSYGTSGAPSSRRYSDRSEPQSAPTTSRRTGGGTHRRSMSRRSSRNCAVQTQSCA